MDTMTLNINVPSGIAVDVQKLTTMATNYVQQYVYMLQRVHQAKQTKVKSTASFRSMRGSLSSNLSYKEMLEEALTEKYKI